MSSVQAEVVRLRRELETTNKELQEVIAENEQYKNYIQSLLEYNNKLVNIIEKELKVGTKIQSNLHPISERTQNDSEMISDNRSLSVRGIKHPNANVLPKDEQQQTAKEQRSVAKLQQIQEEPVPKSYTQTYEGEIYNEIHDLINRYNNEYIAKRDDFGNAFKQIIYSLEDDKIKFGEQQERNIEQLEAKSQELKQMMREVKAMGSAALLSRIAEKNKKIAQDVGAMMERNRVH